MARIKASYLALFQRRNQLSALDSETRQQAEAVARGTNAMAVFLALKIDGGKLASPVIYAPGKQLTIAQIRQAGLARLEMLLGTVRERKQFGRGNGGHFQIGKNNLSTLLRDSIWWSGLKPSLRITWKTIDLQPNELVELMVYYEIEDDEVTARERVNTLLAA